MANNGVTDTATVENFSGENPKKLVDLNTTTEPDDILHGEFKGVSESTDVSGEKKEEANSKATGSASGADSGSVSPVDDIQKKIRRAERFGVSVKLTEAEKRSSRAERFGTVATAKDSQGQWRSHPFGIWVN